jgi:hypothetical protein
VADGAFDAHCARERSELAKCPVLTDDGVFVAADPLDDDDVRQLLVRAGRKVIALLRRFFDEHGADDEPRRREIDGLLQAPDATSATPPPALFPRTERRSARSAFVEGFSLHAATRVMASDRRGLWRLGAYGARGAPPRPAAARGARPARVRAARGAAASSRPVDRRRAWLRPVRPRRRRGALQAAVAAHLRRSVLVTSTLAFSEWPTIFGGDEKLTAALLDRMAETATVISTRGKSYRRRRRANAGRAASSRSTRWVRSRAAIRVRSRAAVPRRASRGKSTG